MDSSLQMKKEMIGSIFSSLLSAISALYADIPLPKINDISCITEFAELVSSSYMREKSASWYAERLGISPRQLSSIVRSSTGRSPKRWIINAITIITKKELIAAENSIEDISISLGFSYPSQFVNFFRMETGYTPLQYSEKSG